MSVKLLTEHIKLTYCDKAKKMETGLTVRAKEIPTRNIARVRLHGPVFSANFGASGGGGFGKIIFINHNKLFQNALYQR